MSDAITKKVTTICEEIYKERGEKSYEPIASKILCEIRDLNPFFDFVGPLICVLHPENIKFAGSQYNSAYLHINIATDKLDLILFKSLNVYVTQKPSQQQIEQNLKSVPFDPVKIRDVLNDKLGGSWIVIGANKSSDWAIAFEPSKCCESYEIKMKENQVITAVQCAQTQLVKIRKIKFSTNQELILQTIEDVSQKHYKSKDFHTLANEVLDRVATLDPYKSSSNPIRCFIYKKGKSSVYDKPDTYLSCDMGDYSLILYEDRFGRPKFHYNTTEVQRYLQTLADNYRSETDLHSAIVEPLKDQFQNVRWDCLWIGEDFDTYAIATRPPNLPIVEARKRWYKLMFGERLFAWTLIL